MINKENKLTDKRINNLISYEDYVIEIRKLHEKWKNLLLKELNNRYEGFY